MKKTIYPAYVPVHFYSKSIDGQGLFYKLEDMLIILHDAQLRCQETQA